MKRIIGILILVGVFTLMFTATVLTYGWGNTLIAWGIAIVLAFLVILGGYLILEN